MRELGDCSIQCKCKLFATCFLYNLAWNLIFGVTFYITKIAVIFVIIQSMKLIKSKLEWVAHLRLLIYPRVPLRSHIFGVIIGSFTNCVYVSQRDYDKVGSMRCCDF